MVFPFQWFQIMNEQMLGNHYKSMRPNTFWGVFFVAKLDLSWQRFANDEPPGFVGHFQVKHKKMNGPQKSSPPQISSPPPPTNQEANEKTETAQVFFFLVCRLVAFQSNATAEVVILESVWKDIVSKEMKCPATWLFLEEKTPKNKKTGRSPSLERRKLFFGTPGTPPRKCGSIYPP